jgi:8-oxo-dGTP pyrophosphatase MutT (NUDIX family)
MARVADNARVPDDLAWIARAEAAGDVPPSAPREPLFVAEHECGSVEPGLAARLAAAGLPIVQREHGWWVTGDADASLAALARWLHDHGFTSRWRDEPLAVVDLADHRRGRVERAAVRPLGIATRAVHLVGTTLVGDVWIQQRAHDKAVDPGRWDTLMGGLVAADESTQETLARETWEEAGLRLAQVENLTMLGRRTVRRPVEDGYMVEHIEMFEALVPLDVAPANQDGEVARFERVPAPALFARLAAGEFTVEAALVLLHWLRRHRLA